MAQILLVDDEKMARALYGDYLRAAGHTVVVVHHDLGTVRRAFDHALLLNVRPVAEGPVAEVLVPEQLRRAYGAGAGTEPLDGEEVGWAT